MDTVQRSVFHQDGVLAGKDDVVLANAFNDDPDADASQLAILNSGSWMSFDIETDRIVTLARTRHAVYAVGRNGLYLRIPLPLPPDRQAVIGATSMSVIRDAHAFGELTRARPVGDVSYVVGQCGQVYRLAENGYQEVSFGLRSDDGPDLEGIGGLSDAFLFACGVGGVILRCDGKRWLELDSPTDVNLSAVLVENERSVFFCGDAGTLVHLRDDRWTIHEGDPDRNYWDICLFAGNPLLVHGSGLDQFVGGNFQPLDPSPGPDNTFYRVHADEMKLLSTGPDDVFIIESGTVRSIPVPGRP
jgi:hypothetical protein